MERRIRYGTILLFLLIAVLFIYGAFFHSWSSERDVRKADLALTASELTRAFDRDEARSDSLFLHKILSVSGVVRQIRQTASGEFTVTLSGNTPEGTAVDCLPDSQFQHRYAPLKAGDSLRIRGICAGRLGNVILVQCIPEK